jgi:hypothetical protein
MNVLRRDMYVVSVFGAQVHMMALLFVGFPPAIAVLAFWAKPMTPSRNARIVSHVAVRIVVTGAGSGGGHIIGFLGIPNANV